jgi:hypothetical protein
MENRDQTEKRGLSELQNAIDIGFKSGKSNKSITDLIKAVDEEEL